MDLADRMTAALASAPERLDAPGLRQLTPESAFALTQERWRAQVQAWREEVATLEATVEAFLRQRDVEQQRKAARVAQRQGAPR